MRAPPSHFHASEATMNCIGSSAYTKVVSRAQGKNHWSFGGRSWKPRARDMFTAPSWGIKEADIEMGATIYRRTRAERWGESHKLAPTPLPTPAPRGGGRLHPLRGVGEGTDGLRVGPRRGDNYQSKPLCILDTHVQ